MSKTLAISASQLDLFAPLFKTRKKKPDILHILVQSLAEQAHKVPVNRSGFRDPLINKRITVPEFPSSVLRVDVDKNDLIYNLRRIND